LTLACKDLDWTRRLAGREEKLYRGPSGVEAAIGNAWLIEPPGGFWPKPGRSAVSGGNRVRVPAGCVITNNKQTISCLGILILFLTNLGFMDFLFHFQLLIGVITQSHSAQPKLIW
jgi:hypothetical protein